MVIDSLFQKRSQNLPVYLQMYPPPPQLKMLKLVRGFVMVSEIAQLPVHVEDEP